MDKLVKEEQQKFENHYDPPKIEKIKKEAKKKLKSKKSSRK